MDERREYRSTELAEEAGVPVRTLRYYQERGLLPPPRKEGRNGWYNDIHLERLRLITDLLARGYRLDGIEELINAASEGRALSDLIGFESAATVPWAPAAPVQTSFEALREQFGDQVDDEVVAEAVQLGYLERDGDRLLVSSPRLLDATRELVRLGIPLRAVLAMGWELGAAFDRMAFMFVHAFRTHLVTPTLADASPENVEKLMHSMGELRPVARVLADEHFGRSMDRRVGHDITEVVQQLAEAASRQT
ncbi:MerR family transcriptional regulator [Nocardia callitridis]|uniref:MerR family transcriptional regulator n=1 Tax=Nocardia callitridis TaxID=648753 RepID=A0ABP9K236_9NOCA